MPFVKLDCGLLDSSLWAERNSRDLFITALLMAEPIELKEEKTTIKIDSLENDLFVVPPGWYGMVQAAGNGIIRRCGIDLSDGMIALNQLASPDQSSRTERFDGRRMVRISGGFIILNYDLYRQKDYSNADRQRRYRERHRKSNAVTVMPVTQAEAYINKEKKKEVNPNISVLTNGWCSEYKAHHGASYLFSGAKDTQAVKRLLSTGLPVPDILNIAWLAWKLPESHFERKHSLSLTSFASRFNNIRDAVRFLKQTTNEPNI